MTEDRPLAIGGCRPLDGTGETRAIALPPDHFTTHGCIVGMTGSGKTGLLMVLVEEALRSRIPVLMIDVKGDLPNLLLTFPQLSPEAYVPWLDREALARRGRSIDDDARALADAQRASLANWGISEDEYRAFRASIAPRVITPGSSAGETLHVLSALERPSPLWATDVEGARESLGASISLLLRLVGRDPDPTRSRDHVVLSVFAERRLRAGQKADVASLLGDLEAPPIEQLGAMPLETYLPKRERRALATALNTLLASPTFESWRKGADLDVGAWLTPRTDHGASAGAGDGGRTPAVIVSVAHLDEAERALVIGVLLEETLAWVRTLPGTSSLRALVVFDEVYGYAPPHPANPPAKRPLIALMKQARAYGVGMLLATQNPMDVDYRALSNAGLWFVGRLQTDADRERVVEGLMDGETGRGLEREVLTGRVKSLSPRWFVMRNAAGSPSCALVQSRGTLCWLRGPMVRSEIARVRR